MSRKLLLICCVAFAHAGTLRTDYSAPAISYSSIRFGASSVKKNPEPFGYDIASAPSYDTLLTTDDRHLMFKTFDNQKADTTNLNTKKFEAITNKFHTTVIESIPQYSHLREPTRPPASRNIPVEPSPDFDAVPSVLKTEGLSAYASFPLETSASKPFVVPVEAKRTEEQVSIVKSIESSPEPLGFSYSSDVNVPSSFPAAFSEPSQVTYSEAPINHVSVSSSGINYSW